MRKNISMQEFIFALKCLDMFMLVLMDGVNDDG